MKNTAEVRAYAEEVAAAVAEKHGIAAPIVKEIARNNGVKLLALTFPEESFGACIYGLEEAFNNGLSVTEEADKAYEAFERSQKELPFGDADDLSRKVMNWQEAKNSIIPCLVSSERNQYPVRYPLTDGIDIIFKIILSSSEEGISATIITEELKDTYAVSVDEILEAAVCNLEKEGYELCSLNKYLLSLMGDMGEMLGLPPEDPFGLYLCQSGHRKGATLNGANVLLNKKAMEVYSEIIGGEDFYVLPSSIHEVLFCKIGNMRPEEVAEMVCSVNANEVPVSDVLADGAYVYRVKTGTLEKVA